MPRKPKFGPGYWVPINELSEPKFLNFRARYGSRGIGLYTHIRQFVRQARGVYELSDSSCSAIAYDVRDWTEEEVTEAVELMLRLGILVRTQAGGFTVPDVQKSGLWADDLSKQNSDIANERHERERQRRAAEILPPSPTETTTDRDQDQGTSVLHSQNGRSTDVVRPYPQAKGEPTGAAGILSPNGTDEVRMQYGRGTSVLVESTGLKDHSENSLMNSREIEKEYERTANAVRSLKIRSDLYLSSDRSDLDLKGGAGGEEPNVLQPPHSPPLESSPAVNTGEPAAAPEPKSSERQEPQPAAVAAAEPAAAVPVLLWFFQLTLENQKIVRGKFEDLARTVGRDDEETQKLAGELLKKGDQKFVSWWTTKRGTRPVTPEDYFSAMTGWVVDEAIPKVLKTQIELESSFEKSPEYRQERRTQYDRARNYARSRGKARDEIFLKLNFAGWRTLLKLTEEKLKQTDSRIEDSLLKDFNDEYQKQRRLHGVGRAPKEEQKKKEQKKEEPKKETLTSEQVEQTPIDEATYSIDCLGSDEDRVKVEACLKRLDLTREEGEAEFRHYWEQRYLGGPTVRIPTPRDLLDFMTNEIFTQDKFGQLQKKKKQKKIENQLAH